MKETKYGIDSWSVPIPSSYTIVPQCFMMSTANHLRAINSSCSIHVLCTSYHWIFVRLLWNQYVLMLSMNPNFISKKYNIVFPLFPLKATCSSKRNEKETRNDCPISFLKKDFIYLLLKCAYSMWRSDILLI